jgi:hypothetical protein
MSSKTPCREVTARTQQHGKRHDSTFSATSIGDAQAAAAPAKPHRSSFAPCQRALNITIQEIQVVAPYTPFHRHRRPS